MTRSSHRVRETFMTVVSAQCVTTERKMAKGRAGFGKGRGDPRAGARLNRLIVPGRAAAHVIALCACRKAERAASGIAYVDPGRFLVVFACGLHPHAFERDVTTPVRVVGDDGRTRVGIEAGAIPLRASGCVYQAQYPTLPKHEMPRFYGNGLRLRIEAPAKSL
jgi:hypothetical protein